VDPDSDRADPDPGPPETSTTSSLDLDPGPVRTTVPVDRQGRDSRTDDRDEPRT
jgi:hypothetical protein